MHGFDLSIFFEEHQIPDLKYTPVQLHTLSELRKGATWPFLAMKQPTSSALPMVECSFLRFIFLFNYVHIYVLGVDAHEYRCLLGLEEGSGSLATGVMGNCEQPNVGAGTRTQLFYKKEHMLLPAEPSLQFPVPDLSIEVFIGYSLIHI